MRVFIFDSHFRELYKKMRCLFETYCTASSLAKVPIRFPPLPLGGFRQVFKLSANMRLLYACIGVTGDVQIRVNISIEHKLGI